MVEKEKRPADAVPYILGDQVCPVCGASLESHDGSVDLYCSNDECPSKLLQRMIFFASKPCMDIKGLGSQMIQDLVESKFVQTPSDLYDLDSEEGELIDMYGEKITKKVFAAIEKSKQQNADRVLKALGYRLVGGHVARALLTEYKPCEGSLLKLAEADIEDIKAHNISGCSDIIYGAIGKMLANPEFASEIKALNRFGVNMFYTAPGGAAEGGAALVGKTFVITGTLPTMSREEAKTFIEAHSGKVTNNVSKNTSYLVAGEAAGSKLDKANALGIPVLDEAGLKAMVNG